MSTVAVCTTLAAYVMNDPDTWGAWLYTAEDMIRYEQDQGREVRFFAAIETDARGLAPFQPLLDRLNDIADVNGMAGRAPIGTPWWTYHLDDGRSEVTTLNRLRHLTMGQNIASEYASAIGATHMLFMAADCCPPADAITKLIEVDHPIVGGHVPTYCLDGPKVLKYAYFGWGALDDARRADPWYHLDVRSHMPTAAFVLLKRNFFKQVKWRADGDLGMSDDPAMYYDAQHLFGFNPPAVVRHDVVGRHYPESIGAIETRGHNMAVHR